MSSFVDNNASLYNPNLDGSIPALTVSLINLGRLTFTLYLDLNTQVIRIVFDFLT